MSSHAQTEARFTDLAAAMMEQMPPHVKSYIRSTNNRTSPRTRYEYLKDISRFFSYLENVAGKDTGIGALSSLKKEDFEEYLEYLEKYDDNGTQRRNGRVSLKRKLSSLRRFFAYLFENGMIPADEIRKIEMPKTHKKEIIRLEQDEAKALLSSAEKGKGLTAKQKEYHDIQSVRDLAIISLLLSTGMRVSECAELDMKDVDMDRCRIRIIRKGGDEATVYFSDEAAEKLEAWLEQRPLHHPHDDETALFLSSRKSRMSVRAIEYLVKKYAARSVPLKKITPHKLRATYATELYNQTGDIYLVADALGHKDVGTTRDHYANLSDDRKRQSRNAVRFQEKNQK